VSKNRSHQLKQEVSDYWNKQSCGTDIAQSAKYSRDYFEEIETYRYSVEPEIFAFAQFTRHYGQKILEVGVGAGTDFLQWVRAGADAHGIDLTPEAIDHVRHRLAIYGLSASDLRVGDAEHIPYPDNSFELVYSWGVIHHSPDTEKAFAEIVRVTKPGGTIKLMVYNRRSLLAFYAWMRFALLGGRPWRSFADVLFKHVESAGTKAYTRSEIESWASRHGLALKFLDTTASPFYDMRSARSWPNRSLAYILAFACGYSRCGWFMRAEFAKPEISRP
jgi:ubiquinone/menaquinone biosynthesis C-methylase UbiE